MNPLHELTKLGQSVWIDFIHRRFIENGLEQLINEDDLRGMTSNPELFDRAIADSHDYDETIARHFHDTGDVEAVYRRVVVEDVQMAADKFRPLYERLGGRDGFVSLELSPHLAHEVERSVDEARELWQAVDRPNIFIKIPATREGLTAIERCIAEGINVNVTLLFGLTRYRSVAIAYLSGIESRLSRGEPIDRVASVASFFLSRVDTMVDERLKQIREQNGWQGELAEKIKGEVAIAEAKLAYQIYKEMRQSDGYRRLEEKGMQPQRLLWASTGTKNAVESDVKYVEPLIGPETITTLPPKTLAAYRDHGRPAPRLEENIEEARQTLESLAELGLDIDKITQQLEDEGVKKFIRPFDSLMNTLVEASRKSEQIPSGTPS